MIFCRCGAYYITCFLQYDGLDTIGNEDDDYMEAEGMEVEHDSAIDFSVKDFLEADDVEEEMKYKWDMPRSGWGI